jgi:hypothetical protein
LLLKLIKTTFLKDGKDQPTTYQSTYKTSSAPSFSADLLSALGKIGSMLSQVLSNVQSSTRAASSSLSGSSLNNISSQTNPTFR